MSANTAARVQRAKGPDPSLPFLAYGLFHPGQLGYRKLESMVKERKKYELQGQLYERDGLPLFAPTGDKPISGALIHFGCSTCGYDIVNSFNIGKHYYWGILRAESSVPFANVLVGRCPKNGGNELENNIWDGWDDPFFSDALQLIEESLKELSDYTPTALMRLHMNYLLLWASIERYATFAHLLNGGTWEKVKYISSERIFGEALAGFAKQERAVYSADSPTRHFELNPRCAEKSLQYYYKIRCNATHRGKAAKRDFGILRQALKELLSIYEKVLAEARNQCKHAVN